MKNILLLAMSILEKDIKDNYYTYGDGELIIGQSPLEPITGMVSIERKKKGERLDKIIILETEETKREYDGKKSAVDFYKERVRRFLDADVYENGFKDIPIDEKNPAEGITEATKYLLHEYEEQKKSNDKMNLWIDTQGGFRDISLVLNAIISLLREQGIEPRGIYSIRYTSKNTKENPCPIVDQKKNYDIFKFVSAMQEFMDYGKAAGLKKYYSEETGFVQTIDGIAEAIQMCQPQKFENAIRKFADYLKAESYKNDDPYLQIFVEFMKSDYGILLEEPDNTIEQIRWCVKKEFYQQAMTIYIEKMPQYYYEKGILSLDVDFGEGTKHGKNPYVKAFYEKKFNEMLKDENDEKLVEILTYVSGCEWVNKRKRVEGYLKAKQAKVENDKLKKAIDTLVRNIRERFDGNGKLQSEKSNDYGAKTLPKYLNVMSGDSGRGSRQELLYGTKIPKKDTLEKKMIAIQFAMEKEPEQVKIMEYYLAMKLLRNRMNHASEDEISEEEQKVIEFLKSEQIDTGIQVEQNGIKIDYSQIKILIIGGLELLPVNEY